MLDTNRMFTLRQVADHGSITAAAEALGYTTSAISQQIAKLEKSGTTAPGAARARHRAD